MARYLLLLIPQDPKLTRVQMQTLTDICIGAGMVSLASVAIPSIFERGSEMTIIVGVVATLVCWYTGLLLGGRIKDE